MRKIRAAVNGWGRGPSWGSAVLVLLLLGFLTTSFGFDSSHFAEYGARSICSSSNYPVSAGELEGGPDQPVTVTFYEGCEASEGKVYTFTGPLREARRWADQTLNRLAAEKEMPALRSKLSSIGSTLGLVGLGLILLGLAVGVWRAVTRSWRRRADRQGRIAQTGATREPSTEVFDVSAG